MISRVRREDHRTAEEADGVVRWVWRRLANCSSVMESLEERRNWVRVVWIYLSWLSMWVTESRRWAGRRGGAKSQL
jgi:hypothetical protein